MSNFPNTLIERIANTENTPELARYWQSRYHNFFDRKAFSLNEKTIQILLSEKVVENPITPLGKIFLGKHLDKNQAVDEISLQSTIETAVRFLDSCLESINFSQQTRKIVNQYRKIALGIEDFEDFLETKKTTNQIAEIDFLGNFISNYSYRTSETLAEEKGSCDNWEKICKHLRPKTFEYWFNPETEDIKNGLELSDEFDQETILKSPYEIIPRRNSHILLFPIDLEWQIWNDRDEMAPKTEISQKIFEKPIPSIDLNYISNLVNSSSYNEEMTTKSDNQDSIWQNNNNNPDISLGNIQNSNLKKEYPENSENKDLQQTENFADLQKSKEEETNPEVLGKALEKIQTKGKITIKPKFDNSLDPDNFITVDVDKTKQKSAKSPEDKIEKNIENKSSLTNLKNISENPSSEFVESQNRIQPPTKNPEKDLEQSILNPISSLVNSKLLQKAPENKQNYDFKNIPKDEFIEKDLLKVSEEKSDLPKKELRDNPKPELEKNQKNQEDLSKLIQKQEKEFSEKLRTLEKDNNLKFNEEIENIRKTNQEKITKEIEKALKSQKEESIKQQQDFQAQKKELEETYRKQLQEQERSFEERLLEAQKLADLKNQEIEKNTFKTQQDKNLENKNFEQDFESRLAKERAIMQKQMDQLLAEKLRVEKQNLEKEMSQEMQKKLTQKATQIQPTQDFINQTRQQVSTLKWLKKMQ